MAPTTDRGSDSRPNSVERSFEERLTLWALRRSVSPSHTRRADEFEERSNALRDEFATAKRLYRCYLSEARRGEGARAPRLAPPGCPRLTRDERLLLRAVAAARVGDDVLLDNRLYKLALDRSRRVILTEAVWAWAAALASWARLPQPNLARQCRALNVEHTPQQSQRSRAAIRSMPNSPEPPAAEMAVLSAIRALVAGRSRGAQVDSEVDRALAQLGAPRAPGFLYRLMWVLEHGACRKLTVHCPCNPAISEDEQLLLDVLALTQERQSFERLLLLRTVLRPTAATPAGQSATLLMRELNRAGLFLLPCYARIRHCAFPPAVWLGSNSSRC